MLRGHSEKIHVASLLLKVPSDFHNSILRNCYNKKGVIKLIFEYIEREAKHCTELSGSSRINLSSESKCILVTSTDPHELFTSFVIPRRSWYKTYSTCSWNMKSSSKVVIHSLAILIFYFLLFFTCQNIKQEFYIIDSRGHY